ncbi:MAG: hypothetical protein ABR974_04035 [Bacteroidales bacterium]
MQISESNQDTTHSKYNIKYKYKRDLIDYGLIFLGKNPDSRLDSSNIKPTHFYFSVSPIVEYTIATGFSFGVAGNVAFKTSSVQETNVSSFLGAIKYTTKKQFLLPVQSSVWTPGNKYNLLGDWRYLDYPQDSYGYVGYNTLSDKYIIDYQQVRFYETVLKNIRKNIYFGFGYEMNHYWNIKETDTLPGRITNYQEYRYTRQSTSSGIAIDFIYDSRENSINPEGGSFYANLQLLQDAKFLGADSYWNSVLIDLRKYIKMPLHTVLALWFYSVITISGDPPYLDLPGTGSDTYNNTGRGYEQARFIGKKMVDLEMEYRFDISRNGLIGVVIFANAESLSELESNKFEVISPGFGIGLRIKFNKFSGTNVCIDYGVGTKGSKGFVGNLGEVF